MIRRATVDGSQCGFMTRWGNGNSQGRGKQGNGFGQPFTPYNGYSIYLSDWYPGKGTDGTDGGDGYGDGSSGYATNGVRP